MLMPSTSYDDKKQLGLYLETMNLSELMGVTNTKRTLEISKQIFLSLVEVGLLHVAQVGLEFAM